MDNQTARPPKNAARVYPPGDCRPNIPRMPDDDTLEDAVTEWAEIQAETAPELSERQIARLRRLFDIRVIGPHVRG